MLALIDHAFTHARTVLSTLVLILITGSIAYVTIPKEAEPDINIPIVYVQLKHEGISPEDAERLLIRPMEQELRAIEGVKEMKSNGYEGGANVILEFEAGFDADKALDDVREKLEYDLYYIENISLRLDFRILLFTIYVMLRFKGQ